MALPETALITELNNKDVYMSNFQETKATVTLTGKVVSNMDVPGHTDEVKCFWIHRSSRYVGGHISAAENITDHPVGVPYTIEPVPPGSGQTGAYIDTLVQIAGTPKADGGNSKPWEYQAP
jgi:hypothetical protein